MLGSPYPHGFTPTDLEFLAEKNNFHPALKAALRWLADDGHLTGALKTVNNMFGYAAINTAEASPQSPQATIAVHKLVEAKDAAIRAWLDSQSDNKNFVAQ